MAARRKNLLSARKVGSRWEIDTHWHGGSRRRNHFSFQQGELEEEMRYLLELWKRGIRVSSVIQELGESDGERVLPNLGREGPITLGEFVKGPLAQARIRNGGWPQELDRIKYFLKETGLGETELHRIPLSESFAAPTLIPRATG